MTASSSQVSYGAAWYCICGRRFVKSNMCLNCGDKYRTWLREGAITVQERQKMSVSQYREWMKVQYEKEEKAVDDAKNMLLLWLRESEFST